MFCEARFRSCGTPTTGRNAAENLILATRIHRALNWEKEQTNPDIHQNPGNEVRLDAQVLSFEPSRVTLTHMGRSFVTTR